MAEEKQDVFEIDNSFKKAQPDTTARKPIRVWADGNMAKPHLLISA